MSLRTVVEVVTCNRCMTLVVKDCGRGRHVLSHICVVKIVHAHESRDWKLKIMKNKHMKDYQIKGWHAQTMAKTHWKRFFMLTPTAHMYRYIITMASSVFITSFPFNPIQRNGLPIRPWSHKSIIIRYTVFAIRYTICSPLKTTFKWCSEETTESRLWRRANRIEYREYRIPYSYVIKALWGHHLGWPSIRIIIVLRSLYETLLG